jgi:uncharacterized cupin superfamily protein
LTLGSRDGARDLEDGLYNGWTAAKTLLVVGRSASSHDDLLEKPRGKTEEHMRRLNFLADEPWDEVEDDRRARWFGHPFEADKLGASLIEYAPQAPGGPLHMHYGVEEMFFVLSGTLTVRTPEGEEELSPGDVVYFPEGPDGLHTFSNSTDEPVRVLGISTKRFPDVVAYPERGVAWVATRHPERPVAKDGDEGVIARFELPATD